MNWAEFCAEHIPEPASIIVEAYGGSNGYGDVYAAAATVTPCVVDHTTRQIRVQTNDAAGAIETSSTLVLCPPGTSAPPKSKVTLPDGSVTAVLRTSYLDAHGLDLPSHVEVYLE
jgi:hypothetical protein